MKKFYTVALSLAVTLSLGATVLNKPHHNSKYTVKPSKELNVRAARQMSDLKTSQSLKVRANEYEEDAEAITNPEGTLKKYSNNATGFASGMFGIDYINGQYPTDIVWGENGEVYIRDIVSMATSGVYVKGTYADGKVTVELPQVCYMENAGDEEDPFWFYLSATVAELYEFEEDGEIWLGYRNVEENNYVVYNVDENGKLTLDLNDGDPEDLDEVPSRIIALVEITDPGVDDWLGYGDSYQEYSEFDLEPISIPETVELEDWVIIASNRNAKAKVGIDGNDVYITDFWEYEPSLTAKGTIDGDKVYFEHNQYLGTAYGYFIYLAGYEWFDEDFIDGDFVELSMDYDASAKIMAVNNPLIDLLLNTSTTECDPIDYYENPTFRYQTAEEQDANPKDPWVQFFDPYQYQDWLGSWEGYIDWMIPSENVNGYVLDTARMYYNILINDEIVEFTADLYPSFEEEFIDIPYEYTDDWDLQVVGDSHYLTFKQEDAETFGCQSFFIGNDGNLYASNLVTYSPSGVESLNTDGRIVEKVEYFDLQGRRIERPSTGVNIVRYHFTDGTTKAQKVVK